MVIYELLAILTNRNKLTENYNILTFMFHFRETLLLLLCGQKSET